MGSAAVFCGLDSGQHHTSGPICAAQLRAFRHGSRHRCTAGGLPTRLLVVFGVAGYPSLLCCALLSRRLQPQWEQVRALLSPTVVLQTRRVHFTL